VAAEQVDCSKLLVLEPVVGLKAGSCSPSSYYILVAAMDSAVGRPVLDKAGDTAVVDIADGVRSAVT
jgi:hypothetical protein